MAGECVSKTWQSEPELGAPARYKKACRYELFVPNPIADFNEVMQVAIEQASNVQEFTLEDLIAIHKVLQAKSSNNRVAGKIRTDQNWIGGNDYNPCGADFVPPPPEDVPTLLIDLFKVINSDVMAARVGHSFTSLCEDEIFLILMYYL